MNRPLWNLLALTFAVACVAYGTPTTACADQGLGQLYLRLGAPSCDVRSFCTPLLDAP